MVTRLAVLPLPEVGAQAMWMRRSLLVLALAEAGEPGAEGAVPGATLRRDDVGSALRVREPL